MTTLAESYDDTSQPGFLVVGVGASAGGVEALRDFFSAVPANSGMAYVVFCTCRPNTTASWQLCSRP
jgi:two-component system CheB/CheR fusion protein